MKEYYELNHEECIKAVTEIMSKTSDLWILWQIYRMAVNITAPEEGGAAV